MAQHEEPPVRRPRKLLWLAIGGVVLSVTLLIAGTVFGHRFPRWTWSGVFDWQLVGLIVLVLSVVTVLLTLLIRAARSRPWTGFGDKTLWDWFQLLIIPLVLAIGGFWFATVQDNRQQELEDQRAQDTALQAYLDQMSELLLSGDLRGSEEGDEVRTLARARTLTVLERVDADREAQVLRFLFEAKLVNSSDPVISLAGADLQEAEIVTEKTERGRFPADWRGINLSGAYLRDAYMVFADLSGAYLSDTNLYEANLNWANLSRADLSGADPSFANLSYADLSGANLSGASLWYANLSDADLSGADLSGAELVGADLGYADLSGANLSGAILSDANLRDARGVTDEQITAAESLESATMPNGQKYEDWLKSKDREKDGKKGTSS